MLSSKIPPVLQISGFIISAHPDVITSLNIFLEYNASPVTTGIEVEFFTSLIASRFSEIHGSSIQNGSNFSIFFANI